MNKEINILILEYNKNDVTLIKHTLVKNGIRFISRVVDGKESFLSELKRFAPDIVLVDFKVPGLSGLEAIEIVKHHDPYLPVILVTGTLDEETAVDCMKAGAWDYILKDRLARLAPAVRGALKMRVSMLEERKANEKLKRSAMEWQTTFDAISEGVFLLNSEGKVQRCNSAAVKLVKKPLADILGSTCCDLLHREMPPEKCVFVRMLISKQRETQVFQFNRRWFQESIDPIFDKAGSLTSAVLVITDITEQKRAEEEMKNLTLFPAENPSPVLRVNRKGVLISANQVSHILLKEWKCKIGERVPEEWHRIVVEVLESKKQKTVELVLGGLTFSFVLVPVKKADYVNLYGRDISETKAAEENLVKERNLLRTLIDGFPDAIYVKDTQSRFLVANTSMAKLVGALDPEELIGKTDFDFFPEEYASDFYKDEQEIVKTGKPILNKEEIAIDKTGKKKWTLTTKVPLFDTDGKVTGIIGMGRDITEQKRAEEVLREKERQLLQAQKMEAMGRLAGGIAHDFNNMLTAIIGYADYLLMMENQDDQVINYLQEIKKAGIRATSLTHQLLTFSRRQVLEPKVININSTIQNLEKMLKQLLGEDIEFIIELDAELKSIHADESHIEQIIVNIAVNARDAMPEGGQLIIKTQNRVLDEDYCKNHTEIEPGNYIMLMMSDTGKGMDRETQQRIFEPFFTTKEMGKGTGLGLSTVYGIVKQMGGHIWVYSEPGKGTTFKIYFPQVSEVAKKVEVEEVEEPAVLTGSERVLLVEDEDQVRDLTVTILEMYGYKVVGVKDAEMALELLGKGEPHFDLLITDMVMPKMSGKELAEKALQIKPGLKVIYISGFQEHALFQNSSTAFLEKPFQPEELARLVRRVLDQNRSK